MRVVKGYQLKARIVSTYVRRRQLEVAVFIGGSVAITLFRVERSRH